MGRERRDGDHLIGGIKYITRGSVTDGEVEGSVRSEGINLAF
jgi:hypothetical protein